jgi:hypothetical protein
MSLRRPIQFEKGNARLGVHDQLFAGRMACCYLLTEVESVQQGLRGQIPECNEVFSATANRTFMT